MDCGGRREVGGMGGGWGREGDGRGLRVWWEGDVKGVDRRGEGSEKEV